MSPDSPIYSLYEGLLTIGSNTNIELQVELTYTITLDSGVPLVTSAVYYARVAENGEFTIPLNVYSSIAEVSLGMFPGTQVNILQSDFDNDFKIKIDVNIKGYNTNARQTRKAATLSLKTEDAEFNLHQFHLGNFSGAPVSPPTRQIEYGLWDDTDSQRLSTNRGTVNFTNLPATVSFNSPLLDADAVISETFGTGRRWYILFPIGVYYRHIHFLNDSPSQISDQNWQLYHNLINNRRIVLSEEVGSGATTESVPIFVDLISL